MTGQEGSKGGVRERSGNFIHTWSTTPTSPPLRYSTSVQPTPCRPFNLDHVFPTIRSGMSEVEGI